MATEYGYFEAFKSTREAQQKFDYYFLGIVLATLSLGIQTNISGPQIYYKYLLIFSWFCWLISFIAGFVRQERTVSVLALETGTIGYKPKQEMFEQAIKGQQTIYKTPTEVWKPEEIEKELTNLNSIIEFSTTLQKKRSKHALIAYYVIKWSYFVGVVSYILFRLLNI